MNSIIDLLQLYLPQFYSFALLGIIYLIWSLSSRHSSPSNQDEELDEETEKYSFRKGKTEYNDPPRSHSPIFDEFFRLAFLGGPRSHSPIFNELFRLAFLEGPLHHQKMTFIISNLIKENLELKSQTKKLECSENLSNLMNNPHQWFRLQYDKMAQLGISRQVEFLYEQYDQILKEVEQIIDRPLFPKPESEVRR